MLGRGAQGAGEKAPGQGGKQPLCVLVTGQRPQRVTEEGLWFPGLVIGRQALCVLAGLSPWHQVSTTDATFSFRNRRKRVV